MDATKRLNVLVYDGSGTTIDSVRQCLNTLTRLLSPNYAVTTISTDKLLTEPWAPSCALLAIPGGADLPYCRTLNGAGNRRIKQFVQRGGTFLGLCAGGYYASGRCEFEVDDSELEVVGDRELGFFPGTCRGCVFPGFVYRSEAGARATELKVSRAALGTGSVPEKFNCYVNGGGVFVDAGKYADKGVEVLASYTEEIKVDAGEGAAAIVYCKVGDGAAILTGPHPEFSASILDRDADGSGYPSVIDKLAGDDRLRTDFFKSCLAKLGLRVNFDSSRSAGLSPMYVSAVDSKTLLDFTSSLEDIITVDEGREYIKDSNDTFHIDRRLGATVVRDSDDGIVDYNAEVKQLVLCEDSMPGPNQAPYFNHSEFYSNLKDYRTQSKEPIREFGTHLLYGEAVTSTSTILEKNINLLGKLPNGFTATATTQLAGRGRGSNVWVSPVGVLSFSTCIHHPADKLESAPVVFLQYLAAIAMVHGIKSYDVGYESLPIKMKWPNDIYALDPSAEDNSGAADKNSRYTKIGGTLVNAHYSASTRAYTIVVGCGINALNPSPTTSLGALVRHHIPNSPQLTLERLLPRILTVFESLYARFLRTGFDSQFEQMYYADWLHGGQIVTLEREGGVRARIRGISRDYGMLVAEAVEGKEEGRVFQLQNDSNSFDFFRGLVKRKV